jgi:putative spermidine/putrescine transport system permease protein
VTIRFWRNLVLVMIVVSAVLPVIPVLVWSFAPRWPFPELVPGVWSLRGWSYVVAPHSHVLSGLLNSFGIAIAVTLAALPIGIPAARALGLHRFRGKRVVEFLVLAPLIVPELPVAMGIHILFIKYGLADTLLGVFLIHLVLSVPYVVLVLSGVFANYGPEIEQSARTLGATPAKTFLYVTLPSIFPGIVVGGLFAFIRSWRTYVFTLMIGGGTVETLPLLLYSFIGTGDNLISAAVSLVFVAPAIAMLIYAGRYLTGTRAAGAFAGI